MKSTIKIAKNLTVNLSTETLAKVNKQKLNLILMQGTASSNVNSLTNAVIAKVKYSDLFEQNNIKLYQSLIGFITKSTLVSGTRIDATTSRQIKLGDNFVISEDNSTVNVIEPDEDTGSKTFMFTNKGNETTVGYSVYGGKKVSHVCAAHIPGRSSLEVMPLNKYLLYFTTDNIFDENYAITELKGNAAIIDYEEDTADREVVWDYHTGLWSKGSAFNALYHPTNNWLTNIESAANSMVSITGSVYSSVSSALNSPLGKATMQAIAIL